MSSTDTSVTFGWNGSQQAYDYDVRALEPPAMRKANLIGQSEIISFMIQIIGEDRRGPQARWVTACLMWGKLCLAQRKYGVDFIFVCDQCGKGIDEKCRYDYRPHDPKFMKIEAESLVRNMPVFLRSHIRGVGRRLTMHFSALLYSLENGRQE